MAVFKIFLRETVIMCDDYQLVTLQHAGLHWENFTITETGNIIWFLCSERGIHEYTFRRLMACYKFRGNSSHVK